MIGTNKKLTSQKIMPIVLEKMLHREQLPICDAAVSFCLDQSLAAKCDDTLFTSLYLGQDGPYPYVTGISVKDKYSLFKGYASTGGLANAFLYASKDF